MSLHTASKIDRERNYDMHKANMIKIKFDPDAMYRWFVGTPNSDSETDRDDADGGSNIFNGIEIFRRYNEYFGTGEWMLSGKREDIEKQILIIEGDALFIKSSLGCFISFHLENTMTVRYVNGGMASYLEI